MSKNRVVQAQATVELQHGRRLALEIYNSVNALFLLVDWVQQAPLAPHITVLNLAAFGATVLEELV